MLLLQKFYHDFVAIDILLFYMIGIIWINHHVVVLGYFRQCSIKDGAGYCPLGGTCCARKDNAGSACIPTVLGNDNATCCYDTDEVTGCAVGYSCEVHPKTGYHYCLASSDVTDGLLQILPRYQLCYQSILHDDNSDIVFDLHGWPMGGESGVVPYYSSHGPLTHDTTTTNTRLRDVTTVIIMMHGALRNADDVYCATLVAVANHCQKTGKSPNSILVVAPRFACNSDNDVDTTLMGNGEVLQWENNDGGYGGSWRYGGNAIWPPYAVDVSSYDVMDIIVHHVVTKLPNVNHVAVTGHSAGGQFVQRWSLLTNKWKESIVTSVVSSPSSYAYLIKERRVRNHINDHDSEWIIPHDPDCPNYNQWMSGFEPDAIDDEEPYYAVPYVRDIIDQHGLEYVKKRYASRLVIYLAASLDRCNVTHYTDSSWCYSHGLSGSCSDEWQGSQRLERHWNFWNMLQRVYDNDDAFHQYRDIVMGVGHDYSLIFTSATGQRATFDPYSYEPPKLLSHHNATPIYPNEEVPIKFFIRHLPQP